MQLQELYMQRCLDLASAGLGKTAPNPLVGSIIVYQDTIIGEGYHQHFGGPHAEVNAIESVKDKSLLNKSVLYVNLEPCSHFGKTPPCADLILSCKIPKVVIGNLDPNPKVCGKGIQKLRDAGVEVQTDVLKNQGEELNKRFFTFHKRSRPYVILKWAQTNDRFIDKLRLPIENKQPSWITNEEARVLVHKWRSEEQAILVGTNTAFMDNPKLNIRNWSGKNPLRVVIDRRLRLPKNLHVFDGTQPTLVITQENTEDLNEPNLEYVSLTFDEYLPEYLLGELYRRQVQSLIIEGGTKILESFIQNRLWDESRVFTGKSYFTEGIPAPVMPVAPVFTEYWNEFKLDIFRNYS